MIIPCGENVLLRRDSVGGRVVRLVAKPADTASVVASSFLQVGARVVLSPRCPSLKIGDLELIASNDVLAIIE